MCAAEAMGALLVGRWLLANREGESPAGPSEK